MPVRKLSFSYHNIVVWSPQIWWLQARYGRRRGLQHLAQVTGGYKTRGSDEGLVAAIWLADPPSLGHHQFPN